MYLDSTSEILPFDHNFILLFNQWVPQQNQFFMVPWVILSLYLTLIDRMKLVTVNIYFLMILEKKLPLFTKYTYCFLLNLAFRKPF
jgi:hypothetical protein